VCGTLSIAFLSRIAMAEDPPSEKPAGKPPAAKEKAEATAKPEGTAETEATKPATYEVTQEVFQIRVKQQALFVAGKMSTIELRPKSTVSLTVDRVVEHGKQVKKGQPLLWLDTTKIDEQIRAAEHNLKLSRLTLLESEAGLKMLSDSLPLDTLAADQAKKLADEDLQYFVEVTRPNSEKSARFSLGSAQHSLEYAQEELDQLKKMYEADDLTEETEELVLKRAQRAVESSKYFLESAQTRHDRTVNVDLPRQLRGLTEAAKRQQLTWEKARATLPSSLKKRQLDLEKAKQQQEKAADDLAKLKKDRQAMIVASPADGVVYYGRCTRGKWDDKNRYLDKLRPGGTLMPKQPVLTIVALRPLLVYVDLPEKDLQHLRRGISGTVKPTAFPDMELPIKVSQLSQIPIAPGTFDCRLRVDSQQIDSRIVPGMSCTVDLLAYESKKAMTIPKTAVFKGEEDPQKAFVYVAKPNEQHEKRLVVPGKRTDKKVEIRKGLKVGDKILLKKPDESE